MRQLAFLIFSLSLLAVSPVFAQQNATETSIHFRFAHFSVDASAVDVYLNDELLALSELQFGTITAWQTLAAGNHTLSVTPAGESIENALIIDTLIETENNDWITVALIGSRDRETLQLQILNEDYSELPSGESRISVFYAVEAGPSVDVVVNGDALFQLVNYPGTLAGVEGDANDGYVSADIVASTYTVQINANESPANLLIDLGDVRFIPNNNYFFAIIGTSENMQATSAVTDLAAVESTQEVTENSTSGDSQSARLRAAHFSSGTPEIDLYINGELSSFGSLGFGSITPFEDFEPGGYSIAIAPAGTTIADVVIGPLEITLTDDSGTTLALIGTLTNQTLQLQVLEEDFSLLAETDARISIFHGIPAISPINVQLADGTVLLQLLAYPGAQGDNDGLSSFELPSGTYDIQVIEANNPGEVLADLRGTRLVAGRHYFLAVILADPPYIFTFEDFE